MLRSIRSTALLFLFNIVNIDLYIIFDSIDSS